METRRRTLRGVVVSHKMMKTAVVAIVYQKRHPRYLKDYTVTRRLKAHNPDDKFKDGDKVLIEETRPISRDNHWRIVAKIS